jgi:ribonuclease HI
MNTWFNLPARRLYTWKSPQDSNNNIVRNQIDYIAVNKRFRNSIKKVTTYPGADLESDHNPVVAKLNLNWKRIKREDQPQKRKRIDLSKLANIRNLNHT